MHVMIDLETLGKRPGCKILSIGAVTFHPDTGVKDEFYVNVDPHTQEGLHSDPDTVKWWKKQSRAAKDALTVDRKPLAGALQLFTSWYINCGGEQVWGNGATFDNVILTACYEYCKLERPWRYRDDRCHRTLVNEFGRGLSKPLFQGVAHNALDDARFQAQYAAAILKAKQ